MTPLMSWMLFGACIAVGAWVYVAVVGGRRYRRMERDYETSLVHYADVIAWPVSVSGGIYDHEDRGDFHDPIRDHEWCDDCNARLRRAFNRAADLDLGPRDVDALMVRLRELAR